MRLRKVKESDHRELVPLALLDPKDRKNLSLSLSLSPVSYPCSWRAEEGEGSPVTCAFLSFLAFSELQQLHVQ